MKIKAGDSFVFDSYSINSDSREFKFRYVLERGGGKTLLEEAVQFPKNLNWNKVPDAVLKNALETVHLALGVSYWKTYCPRKIILPEYSLTKEEARFWNDVYEKGLGEFFYRNKIDFRGFVKFPHATRTTPIPPKPYPLNPNSGSLLLFGGGKDSLVSAELMKSVGKPFTYFHMSYSGKLDSAEKLFPKDGIFVRRVIDPQLAKINKEKGVFNGHVPSSAIIAAIAELAAILYGYRYVVSSNERSANYGNIKYLGRTVNHQWSKSIEFERAFQCYSRKFITQSVTYFSLLRPIYELKIIEIFSRFPKYFRHFTSCNRNFRILDKTHAGNWCGECPKCAFVFAMLSAFIPKSKLVGIFNKNLYADKTLSPVFKELLGIAKFKPFECVGTPEEMTVAMAIAASRGEYDKDAVMEMFIKQVLRDERGIDKLTARVLSVSKDNLIPGEFMKVIKQL